MENRALILPLRVTQAEREAIRQDAEKQGMTVSGYLRWLIEKERNRIDHQPAIDAEPVKHGHWANKVG